MSFQVGDEVILTKTGARGTIHRKGPFGWFVRFGEWEHYPIQSSDLSPTDDDLPNQEFERRPNDSRLKKSVYDKINRFADNYGTPKLQPQ